MSCVPACLQGILDLTQAVYSQAIPKLVQGKPMTGPIMVQLLEAAVHASNTGKEMNLPTVLDAMVMRELQAATAAAEQVYGDVCQGFVACRSEDMMAKHSRGRVQGNRQAEAWQCLKYLQLMAITSG